MPKVPVSGSHSVRVRKWKPWLLSAGQAPINRKRPISPMSTSVDTAAERAAATKPMSCAVGRVVRTRRTASGRAARSGVALIRTAR